jgi:hypothetical protein
MNCQIMWNKYMACFGGRHTLQRGYKPSAAHSSVDAPFACRELQGDYPAHQLQRYSGRRETRATAFQRIP